MITTGKLIKSVIALSIIALLAGCANTSFNDINKNYDPKFLFEFNGIKVYRFVDNGRLIYFTDRGEVYQGEK